MKRKTTATATVTATTPAPTPAPAVAATGRLRIELLDITRIKPYASNVKLHDEAQVARIAQSIARFGWDQPIVVDRNHVIIKGHGRRLAALRLGLDRVPVLVRDDLTDDEARAARLADNRVAIGDVDAEMLQRELAALTIDLDGIFDRKELDFLTADPGEMSLEAFSLDLDDDVAAQSVETAGKIRDADERPVKIGKALGFDTVPGRDERLVARFMAQAEAETGVTGADAFVTFIRKLSMELADV
jgi:hypothetical protein